MPLLTDTGFWREEAIIENDDGSPRPRRRNYLYFDEWERKQPWYRHSSLASSQASGE